MLMQTPSFNSCVQVQRTIGVSDYVRRDMALKNLIQPLAGEYGMHNNQPQLKTHRYVAVGRVWYMLSSAVHKDPSEFTNLPCASEAL